MTTVSVPTRGSSCPKCVAGLDQLIVGGVGDWRTKIVCQACLTVWMESPGTIAGLAAMQYGMSEEAIRQADQLSQREFESVSMGGQESPDLPPALPIARWHARRLAACGRL